MSPGPLTTSARGGFGFRTHGGGFGRSATPNRTFTAQNRAFTTANCGYPPANPTFAGSRQRFSVGGDGKITLDPGEGLRVDVGENGEVTISVAPPENGNGDAPANGGTSTRGLRQKMSLVAGEGGALTISPEPGHQIALGGDPAGGFALIVEVPSSGNGE